MRGFTIAFAALLVVCVSSNQLPTENCHPSGCIAAEKCSARGMPNFTCPIEGEVCCSLVKEEDKHRCSHFLGECMESCNPEIQRLRADDCKEGTKCCVLVD